MDKPKITKLEIFFVVLGVILLAGVFGYTYYRDKNKISDDQEKKLVVPEVTRALENETAETFPDEIPLYSRTKIIESYSATYPGTTAIQSTITFTTSQTDTKAFDFYLNWAKENGWRVSNSSKDGQIKSLYLLKMGEAINISISGQKITVSHVLK